MASTKRDYYEVLEVSRDADEETLKRAYRRLAMKYHPDRNPGDAEAEAKFKEAAEAYAVLSDPGKRQRYDRYGHSGVEEMGGPGFGDAASVMDIFGDLFGDFFGGGGGRRRRGPQAGRDLQLNLELTLVEAYQGVRKELKIPREELCHDCSGSGAKRGTTPVPCRRCGGQGVIVQGQGLIRFQQTCGNCRGRGSVISDPCPNCRGAGRVEAERELTVTIPPGVDDGMTVRVPGEGEAGDPGAPPGDLYCVVRVRPDRLFVRRAQELHCEVPITISQAALGAPLEVPTLAGKYITVQVPKGTQTGDEVRVPGKGMPSVRGGRSGDLIVHLRVVTPRNLTKRQEELLRELGDLDGAHVAPERKGFLDRVREFFASLTDSKGDAGENAGKK